MLLGSHTIDMDIAAQDQRARLLNGTERLNRASDRLEEARRLAHETEAIGVNTLETLGAQREQILRTRDTVRVLRSLIISTIIIITILFLSFKNI